MNIKGIHIIVCCLLLSVVFSCKSTKPFGSNKKKDVKKWNLVWQDSFDGKLNPNKWAYSTRNKSNWACYCTESKETVFKKNGNLVVRASVNKAINDSTKYITGCIQTKDKFSFKYGKVEVRAKFKSGKGAWPAIWLMPQNNVYGTWPNSGEIDIMEQLNFDNKVFQSIHSNYADVLKPEKALSNHGKAKYNVNEFNVYGLEWYPNRLEFYVNGEKTFTYFKLADADYKQWPFDQEFYLILNQAVGGNWVGNIIDEDLPVDMFVDYVRIYQERE